MNISAANQHDPLCPHNTHPFPASCETCALIADVRADERVRIVLDGWVNPDAYRANVKILREQERELIAQAIEAIDPVEWALAGQDAGRDAARIARGGSDE